MKTLDNRFYVKFMQLEIGLLCSDYACWRCVTCLDVNRPLFSLVGKCGLENRLHQGRIT